MKDKDLYLGRKLSDGYPDLEQLGHDHFIKATQGRSQKRNEEARVTSLVQSLGRITELKDNAAFLVVGCGPQPEMIRLLRQRQFKATGIEPVASYVESARAWLQDTSVILEGCAEKLPVADGSQDVVILASVLEHVDSVTHSLGEAYRVLAPGGIAYISTTNRLAFSLTGRNGEYNVRFYNCFPALVKECYVHQHLHFNPKLANYTPRPAVHWFTYARLCEAGRNAGFSRFYSPLDVKRMDDDTIRHSALRRALLPLIQRKPWLRALALTQKGSSIFMVRR